MVKTQPQWRRCTVAVLVIGCALTLTGCASLRQAATEWQNPGSPSPESPAPPALTAPPAQPQPAAGARTAMAVVSSRNLKESTSILNLDVRIPVVSGVQNPTAEAELNGLLEKRINERKVILAQEARDYMAEAKKLNVPFHPFELSSIFNLTLNRQAVLSLYTDTYEYTGGAHGGTERQGYTVDLVSGQRLAVADLFSPGFEYQNRINQEIRSQMSAHPDNYFPNAASEFKGISPGQGYYLAGDQLIIFFPQYEIAPYASGIPTFTIPLAQLQDGLKPDYAGLAKAG